MLWPRQIGLTVPVSGPLPDLSRPSARTITEEAALTASAAEELRVTMLAEEGDLVAQGSPVLAMRHRPEVVFTAPMAARVASVDLAPGRRLSEVRLFREDQAGRHEHGVKDARAGGPALRKLLLSSGMWHRLRSRPYGPAARPDEQPGAIFVMGLDTRPNAPDPRLSIRDREDDLARGITALATLTDGPVFLCQDTGPAIFADVKATDRIRVLRVRPIHPWGQAGFLIHRHHPASLTRPVWDIHVEDVAGIGALLATGLVDETRLLSVAGSAMTEAQLVRCQPGADLRSLSYANVRPGPHEVLSGSPLDGRKARWLGARDRQVSVMTPTPADHDDHWLLSALKSASRPLPVIPTAALERTLGGAFPALPLLRAIAVGDREAAIRLGALSLVAEDLALADYVTAARPRHSAMLAAMLGEIAAEEAA